MKLFIWVLLLLVWVSPGFVLAAQLTNRSDIMTRVKVGEGSSHVVTFILDGLTSFDAGETLEIDFGEDNGAWTVDGGNMVVNDLEFNDSSERVVVGIDGSCSGHFGQDDVVVSANDTAGIITFTACDNFISNSNGVTVEISIGTDAGGTDRVVNPIVPGAYQIVIGGSMGDTGEVEIDIVTEDQTIISGIVDETLQFVVSDNSVGFGEIDYTQSRYATGDEIGSAGEFEAHTISAAANATNGYTITMDGSTLFSGGSSINPAGEQSTLPAAGTEQFGLRIVANGGNGQVQVPYGSGGFAFDVNAFPDEIAFSIGSSDNTIYSMRYLLSISEDTEGGVYSTVINYLISALF